MLHAVKRIIRTWILRPLVLLGARIVAFGLARFVADNSAHALFDRHGYHLLRKHFYLPIPETDELTNALSTEPSDLVGVDMRESHAVELLEAVLPGHAEVFRERFPLHKPREGEGFFLLNGSFMAVDAHVYHAFLRHFAPKRVVEIGSGYSTLLGAASLEESGKDVSLTAIEPYPSEPLKRHLPSWCTLLAEPVQNVDLEIFTGLERGDVLFVDSTHVVRSGGDVQMEFCEILPRLASGVLVHIHDISLPLPYPKVYAENHWYFAEQYILQAFLTGNDRYKVLWPASFMFSRHEEALCRVFPEIDAMRTAFPEAKPTSFWLQVR